MESSAYIRDARLIRDKTYVEIVSVAYGYRYAPRTLHSIRVLLYDRTIESDVLRAIFVQWKGNEPSSREEFRSIIFVEIQDSTVERILKAARRVEARIVYRTTDSCRESSLSSFDLATE